MTRYLLMLSPFIVVGLIFAVPWGLRAIQAGIIFAFFLLMGMLISEVLYEPRKRSLRARASIEGKS